MSRMFSPRELLELLLLIGYFRMICGVMNTLDVEVEAPFGGRVLELVQNTSGAKTRTRRPANGNGRADAMIESG